jgi:hypothetical protein
MNFLQGFTVLFTLLVIASSTCGVIALGLLFPLVLPWVLLVMLVLTPVALVRRVIKEVR